MLYAHQNNVLLHVPNHEHVCREECSYELTSLGFCAITGCNMEDEAAESNGAGKSALAMSGVWALSGRSNAGKEVARNTMYCSVVHHVLWSSKQPQAVLGVGLWVLLLYQFFNCEQHSTQSRQKSSVDVTQVLPDTCMPGCGRQSVTTIY